MSGLVGWGILGSGVVARRFAYDLQWSDTGKLVSVWSRDCDRALSCRAAAGAGAATATVEDSWQAMLKNPAVDIVYIALPTALHSDFALEALAAGKAVLCEKPIAATAAAARRVQAAAEAAGLFCMESMWTRFLPVTRSTKQKVVAGDLGKIVHFHASMGFPRQDLAGNAASDPALGGGALLDMSVYPLSLALHLLGPLELVSAAVTSSEHGTDRDVAALLRATSAGQDALVTMSASHSSRLRNTLEISGTRKRLVIYPPFIAAHCARVLDFGPATEGDAEVSRWRTQVNRTRLGRWALLEARKYLPMDGKSFGTAYRGTGLQFAADEAGRCLLQGETQSAVCPMADSVRVLELNEEIRRVGDGNITTAARFPVGNGSEAIRSASREALG